MVPYAAFRSLAGECGATKTGNFQRVPLVNQDLSDPLELAVLPDRRVLYIQRTGQLKSQHRTFAKLRLYLFLLIIAKAWSRLPADQSSSHAPASYRANAVPHRKGPSSSARLRVPPAKFADPPRATARWARRASPEGIDGNPTDQFGSKQIHRRSRNLR